MTGYRRTYALETLKDAPRLRASRDFFWRVGVAPPEEVPVRAEPRLVLQRLERVRASVAGHALLDECRSYIVGGLDAQTRHVERQRLEAGKLRCQVRPWPQHHVSGNRVSAKEVARPRDFSRPGRSSVTPRFVGTGRTARLNLDEV